MTVYVLAGLANPEEAFTVFYGERSPWCMYSIGFNTVFNTVALHYYLFLGLLLYASLTLFVSGLLNVFSLSCLVRDHGSLPG